MNGINNQSSNALDPGKEVSPNISIEIKITLLGISGNNNNTLLTSISNSEYRKHLMIDDQSILVDFLDTAGKKIANFDQTGKSTH